MAGKGKARFLIMQIASFFCHMGENHVTDYLIGIDQKISEWLIIFLGKVEIVIRSNIKSRFGIVDFSTSGVILDLWFSL